LEEAIAAYEKVISFKPDYAEAYNHMGIALHKQEKIDEAITAYEKAISLKPDYAEAYNHMGIALHKQQKREDAIAAYEKAISLNPDNSEIYYNMGITLQRQEKLDESITAYKKAISFKPDYAEAYNNMGIVLSHQGKLEDAIRTYQEAISLKPNHAEAYNNMGIALKNYDKPEEAITAYEKAISLRPKYAQAFYNLGIVFLDLNKLREAEIYTLKAIEINPNYADFHYNLGAIHQKDQKLKESITAYEKVLSLDPNNSAARTQKLFQQSHICDWTAVDADSSYFAELGVIYKDVSPFSMLSIEDAPDRHRLRSELYARERILQKPLPAIVKPSKVRKRLRIGYFSTDFKEHPVAYLIAKVLEQHNRDAFEVFGYCLHSNKESPLRRRLINSFDYFFEAKGISDKDVALKAREDGIDIAIDLNGYTQDARPGIFAYRAAPIQINYLGYPGTLGAEFMDYIVADKYLIPPDSEKHFNEKKIYLPNTYMPTDDGREISSKEISRSEMGLPEDAFVFCCFNNNYKITSSEFDIWMRLLKKIDKSVLWLRQSNQFSHINIRNEAERRNVDPSRIVFAKRAPMDEHLARQKLADLFIDTFAFNAHTTTTEALWAGLPVITKAGKGFAARVAGSLLNAIGLPELITETEQDYEALALEIATHPDHLKQIKAKLNTNRLSKPLFDTKQYTYHLETAYKMAYNDYLNQQKVENIFVPS